MLKPAFLRDPDTTFNSRALTQGPWWAPKKLRVWVWPDTGGMAACGSPFLLIDVLERSLSPPFLRSSLDSSCRRSIRIRILSWTPR